MLLFYVLYRRHTKGRKETNVTEVPIVQPDIEEPTRPPEEKPEIDPENERPYVDDERYDREDPRK